MDCVSIALGCLLLGQAAGSGGFQPNVDSPEPERLPAPAASPVTGQPATEPSPPPAWKSGQDAPGETAAEPGQPSGEPGARQGLPADPSSRDRPTPPQLAATVFTPRARDGLTGEPITLSAALGSVPGRSGRAQLVHAYWRLARSVALAHLAADHEAGLARLEASGDAPPALTAARASAAAASAEARADAVSAQHQVAALVSHPVDAPLPLPADLPHVGPYVTHFHRLLAEGRAPASARVLDRQLPILWEAVEARARAAVAADRAYQATAEAYAQGRAELDRALEAADHAAAQHRAFAGAVILYNRDIADYALAVATPAADARALVNMMIEPGPAPAEPVPGSEGSGVQPTVATEPSTVPRTARGPSVPAQPRLTPIPDPGGPSGDPSAPAVHLRHVPRGGTVLDEGSGPTPTPAVKPPGQDGDSPRAPTRAVHPDAPRAAPRASIAPAGQEPTLAPERPAGLHGGAVESPDENGRPPESPAASPRPVVPVEPAPHAALRPAADADAATSDTPEEPAEPIAPDTAFAPGAAPAPKSPTLPETSGVSDADAAAETDAAAGIYGPLRDASPGRRAKQLALTLHWDRALPEGIGEPLDLAECVRGYGGKDRVGLVAAYWQVREAAARYQAVVEHAQWLDEVWENATTRGADERSPAGLRLESARLAAEAERHEAHASLVRAQFDLAVRLERSPEDVWPMAATPPHAGPYLARLNEQPRPVAESWTMRRRAAVLPGLWEAVYQRATAVVEADAARAAAARDFAAGGSTPDTVLKSIRRQAGATSGFLQALTEYNRAIAAYALSVLPPDVPADTLVSALVVP